LQYKFAELLAGGRGNICVVGDDDQSIYKFRGATIGNILNFEHRYKNAKLIRLEENYRSTAYILAAANDVIRNNTGRRGKNLWTRKAGGEKPALYVAANERDEARFVAESIVASVGRGGKWSDNAVLYRMNAQSNQLEHAFKGAGVPYRVLGGVSFYERAEIKDILSYLCVINNPSDDLRLLRIINNPARGIGQRTIAQLSELAAREREPIFALIQRAGQYAELQKSAARLRAFYDMMSGLRELAASAPPPELYDALIESSGYVRALETGSTIENMARVENVSELKTNILNYMEDNSGGSLDGFLSETALYANLDRDDGENDRAVLMTMHSAKGLEFDNVFIVGADEGVFPGARAIGEPDEMEEERRLCYVAITRARKTLCFVSARQRTLFGRTTPGNASRFIGEISAENINRPRGGRSGGYVFDDDTYADAAERPRSGAARGRATYAPPPARGDASGERGQTRPSALDLSVGDVVEHKAFGRGLVTLVQHGGKDALLEIAFDSGGTKRFMLNTVSQYLSLA
jgi:DNA helicase-2/ATP-dependent DNA helicase PcrA